MQNTEHDERLNRSTWTGEAWLGVESMRAPVHTAPIDWLQRGGNHDTRTERKEGYSR